MKRILVRYILTNKFVLENISRSLYGFGVALLIALIVAYGIKPDSVFDLKVVGVSVGISFVAFFLGIIVDNIRKDM